MRKKIITLILLGMISVSGVKANFAANPNTIDTSFSYNNSQTYQETEWRYKYNTSKVYVYPKSGPKINYRVIGRNTLVSNVSYYRSNLVNIPTGVQGSITNQAVENGDDQVKIYMQRIASYTNYTNGVWSPDSTRNYTVFD